jgi:phosphatidylglycerol:prolipoprotein diacylglycerol transferase
MYPEILRIQSFVLHSYGLLVALGFLVGLWLAGRLATESGLDADKATSLGIYVTVAAIVGAKLLLVLSDYTFYLANPREIFSINTLQAGGIFFGGLVAALATAAWYMRHAGLPALRTADAFAPGLAIGHAIGRVGCFLAGCCWGKQTSVPWAVTFTNPVSHELVGVPLGIPLHPTQLYESLAELVIFVILWSRFRRAHQEGAILGLYLILYPAFRFVIEFWRDRTDGSFPLGGPLSITQWLAAVLVLAGAYLVVRHPRERNATA